MPRCLLSVCHDEEHSDLSFEDPEFARSVATVSALHEQMRAAEVLVFAGGLEAATVAATVVRATDSSVSMIDDGRQVQHRPEHDARQP